MASIGVRLDATEWDVLPRVLSAQRKTGTPFLTFMSRWRFVPQVLFVVAAVPAGAAAAEPALAGATTRASEDDQRAAAVLTSLGQQAGESKTVGGWSTVILGAAATTTGILVDRKYDASYGTAIWIGGVSLIAGGLTSFLIRPPIESFAEEMHSSPTELQAKWRARAAEAKSRRQTVGILDLSVGAAGAVAATVLAAGVSDLSREDRAEWVVITGLFAGGSVASGLIRLLVESDIEKGYALAYPQTSAPEEPAAVDVGLAPLPNGAAVQLFATF